MFAYSRTENKTKQQPVFYRCLFSKQRMLGFSFDATSNGHIHATMQAPSSTQLNAHVFPNQCTHATSYITEFLLQTQYTMYFALQMRLLTQTNPKATFQIPFRKKPLPLHVSTNTPTPQHNNVRPRPQTTRSNLHGPLGNI